MAWPVEEVARRVRAAGPKVCVFPINGTRRWFLLECQDRPDAALGSEYVDRAARRHIELYRLLFDHGLDTLLTPVFGPDLLARGPAYFQVAAEGLRRLATHPEFLAFYDEMQVRVRFYGDYGRHLVGTEAEPLIGLFESLEADTRGHDRFRLFFGLFAHDAVESVAELAVEYHQRWGKAPDRAALVEAYYGEPVAAVDLFIGFDKFCVFDMPLLTTGNEDLYFTVSPSLYLNERGLRRILYDHLYSRRQEDHQHTAMTDEDWEAMRTFYRANAERCLGVGVRQARGGFWYPLPEVELPDGFLKAISPDR